MTKQGTFGGKQTSVFTLSDSFSMEAIQVYKLKVTLLSILSNIQSHMRYISKGVAMVMRDLISSVPKDFYFFLLLEIGGVLGEPFSEKPVREIWQHCSVNCAMVVSVLCHMQNRTKLSVSLFYFEPSSGETRVCVFK